LETLKQLPAETSDGRRLSLYANIGLIADLLLAHRHGAQGVGLYRTEFPFLTYREFPDEEEQYDLYARVVRGMEGKPVTIRTLDVGADKYPAYMQVPREDNPYLGWRSIRISLEMPEFFKVQLRAILRAVDRNNRKVAPVYEPLHPAVLSAVHEVVQAAKGAGKWVGMCGEMASDPLCTLVLLGFGLDDLSMGPFFIPVIKRIIRSVSY